MYHCCYSGLLFSQGHPAAEQRNMGGNIDSLFAKWQLVLLKKMGMKN